MTRPAHAPLALLVALLATRALPAQAPSAALFGAVSDQFGQAVVGAEVIVGSGAAARTTRTAPAGAYRVDSLPPGASRVRIRLLGYLPLSATLPVAAGDARERDFTVVRLPTALDPALVQTPDGEYRASDADFTARQAGGAGMYLDRAAIDRLAPTTATDLMRAVKRFRVLAARDGGVRVVSADARDANGCQPRVLVDGFAYTPVDGINDFDPEHIGAIEAYASGETPPPLAPLAGPCGTVVVWLRR
ncbi:MAG: hypothetical protein AVDCRST_MAG11-2052 [uncultured Gemmatimonadaceae bacterium]|uniref:TonB-dependent receptor plug domain-containing protein n=1 Tax=uncultured Gemmatimonadaceae bacterium TaxID=246130 RepID=A0A6J4L5M0_9BACT|nr:MAG: hypothetical protein AVDCRST_MAG11-2052 [uncultured Gemmatimonadaceae bacterium]